MDLDQDFIENGPSTYSTVKSLPLILSLVALVLAVLAVFSSKSRLHGLRKTGQLLFSIGLLWWLMFYASNRVGEGFNLVKDPGNPNEEIVAELGQPLIRAAFNDLTTTGLWVALTVVLTGALMWLGAFIWHKAHHHNEAEQIAKRTAEQKSKPDPKLPKPIKPGKD